MQLIETYTDLPVESRTAYRIIVTNNPVNFKDPTGKIPIELWPPLISCPGAIYECLIKTSCADSIECADEHRDPAECFDREETEIGSAHQLKECLGNKPECIKCMEALLKCGF